jgi:hypothetical protein
MRMIARHDTRELANVVGSAALGAVVSEALFLPEGFQGRADNGDAFRCQLAWDDRPAAECGARLHVTVVETVT